MPPGGGGTTLGTRTFSAERTPALNAGWTGSWAHSLTVIHWIHCCHGAPPWALGLTALILGFERITALLLKVDYRAISKPSWVFFPSGEIRRFSRQTGKASEHFTSAISMSTEHRCKKMPHGNTAFTLSTYERPNMPMDGEQVSLAIASVSFTAWCKVQAKAEPLMRWEKITSRTGRCN